jgi:hypothetical protein
MAAQRIGSPAAAIRGADKVIIARYFADFAPPYLAEGGQVQPVLGRSLFPRAVLLILASDNGLHRYIMCESRNEGQRKNYHFGGKTNKHYG